ncbi:sugar transferase [Arthrobacter sp. NPDC090010]|uniref:sugar transferase n=1 Tax=Arthrobacter sp. NPDC090010 TaxID=3363942 RepID=UPI00382643F0
MRLLDLSCIVLAVMGAYLLRFGFEDSVAVSSRVVDVSYMTLSLFLIAAWWVVLEYSGTRDRKIIGTGIEEYRRVTIASLWLFGAVAVVSYVLKMDTARGYVAVALPLGVAFLVTARWAQRKALHRTRLRGQNLHRVLLLGASHSVEHLNEKLDRHIVSGYKPVASFLTDMEFTGGTLPIMGTTPTVESVLEAIDRSQVDTVAITSGAELDPVFLRHLGWALSAREVGMIMAPALTDISGPRIHMQPVAGLPLIHVTTPKLDGLKAFAKRSLDIVGSLSILTLLAVPMLIIAAIVKLDSPGPALFFQERIGKGGQPFKMIKFRSMRTDAEALFHELQAQTGDSMIFFKMKKDPRVTRFGAWIRRYSIDELPQLLNVLNGTMSLVGPRPQVAREVEMYDMASHRRLLVKPGMTGLWQVSGRNDLSLEESIRLDLYYVENWSLAQDVLILFRTAKAVVGKDGAY